MESEVVCVTYHEKHQIFTYLDVAEETWDRTSDRYPSPGVPTIQNNIEKFPTPESK